MVRKNYCDGGIMKGQYCWKLRTTCNLNNDLVIIVVMKQPFSFLSHFRV